MKKTLFRLSVLMLVTVMLLTVFVGCNPVNPPDSGDEVTVEEVYNSSKTLSSLLGEHENLCIEYLYNGKLFKKEILGDGYIYTFYEKEYHGLEYDIQSYDTADGEYYFANNYYSLYVILNRGGLVDMNARFNASITSTFSTPDMLNYDYSITKSDGSFIVSCTADSAMLANMNIEGLASFKDTYTLDAETREVTSNVTVYSYEDGSTEEYTCIFTRNIGDPEEIKPLREYAEETENFRTVTIVSHPGTENEKIEYVKSPKGLLVTFSIDWDVVGGYDIYADAACTQPITGEPNPYEDITVYVKWTE